MKLDKAALRSHPLPAIADDDKDSKGRLLILAGSRDVPGAALLTATAAMRAGAGKLKIATVDSVSAQIGVAMPEAMAVGLPQADDGGFAASAVDRLSAVAEQIDAIVAGPGVQPNATCAKMAKALLASDAALALDVAFLEKLARPKAPRSPLPVLLPNSDELAALLKCDEDAVRQDPIGCGRRAANTFEAVVLVKGVTSHVVTPDGEIWTYRAHAPGLGVSGSGDVLAGIVGGLLARGAEPLSALLWAVWLHGEAGRRLGRRIGPIGYLAREIADEIPPLLPR